MKVTVLDQLDYTRPTTFGWVTPNFDFVLCENLSKSEDEGAFVLNIPCTPLILAKRITEYGLSTREVEIPGDLDLQLSYIENAIRDENCLVISDHSNSNFFGSITELISLLSK
jgi:hypothetical protein